MKQTFILSIFAFLLVNFSLSAQPQPPYGTCDAVAGAYTPPIGASTDADGNLIYNALTGWNVNLPLPEGSLPNNAFVFDIVSYENGELTNIALATAYDDIFNVADLGLSEEDVLHVYTLSYEVEVLNATLEVSESTCIFDPFNQNCDVLEEMVLNGGIQNLDDALAFAGFFFGEITSVADVVFYMDTLNQIIANIGPILGIEDEICFAYNGINTPIVMEQTPENVNTDINNPFPSINSVNQLSSAAQLASSPEYFSQLLASDSKIFDTKNKAPIATNVTTKKLNSNLESYQYGNPKSINIYPNPSNNFIYVDLNGKAAISKIEVYDTNGQLHLLGFNQRLDISSLPLGFYTLHVQTIDNQLYQNRFVKTE